MENLVKKTTYTEEYVIIEYESGELRAYLKEDYENNYIMLDGMKISPKDPEYGQALHVLGARRIHKT